MITFSEEKWKKIENTYENWWNKSLDRAVLLPTRYGESKDLKMPVIEEPIAQKHFADPAYSTDAIAERIVYDVSRQIYLGDAFPYYNMDISGPGIIAAYLGANLGISSTGNIWFHPMDNRPLITELSLHFDPENFWFQRTLSIIRKVKELSEGNMVLAMPDLGGTMDILSSFFPGEELLFALYDYPEEVGRLVEEMDALWINIYEILCKEFAGFKGYSDWSGIYSKTPTYIHQSDFSYMIGPNDFDQFVLGSLKKSIAFTPHSIYHLDGKGELKHLDKILDIAALDAVQWVPGDGNGSQADYPEVLEKIVQKGKNLFLFGHVQEILRCYELLGTTRGFYCKIYANENLEEGIEKIYALSR